MTQTKVKDTMNIIDNLLLWNQNGIDGIQPKAQKCELQSLFDRTLIQLQPQIEKKKLKILCSEQPPIFAFADADHILIVLLNIVTNAIKFSPLDEDINVAFSTSIETCHVAISNNGRGIGKEQLQKIFTTSHITSSRGTMDEKGTGLGLKICKSLIEKNNGSIDVTSEIGKKTTVTIQLPAYPY
jgi:signal transduction histidine kinase